MASISTLPVELLAQIISQLDAPGAVCFALTSHYIYDAVLLICKVCSLGEVCPKDIRRRHPRAIEAQAYNLLFPVSILGHPAYAVRNLVLIPQRAFHLHGGRRYFDTYGWKRWHPRDKLLRLAFIRRVMWLKDGACDDEPVYLSETQKYLGMVSSAGDLEIYRGREILIPVMGVIVQSTYQIEGFIKNEFKTFFDNGSPGESRRHWSQLYALLCGRDNVLLSVEYLVLREMLAGWLGDLKKKGHRTSWIIRFSGKFMRWAKRLLGFSSEPNL